MVRQATYGSSLYRTIRNVQPDDSAIQSAKMRTAEGARTHVAHAQPPRHPRQPALPKGTRAPKDTRVPKNSHPEVGRARPKNDFRNYENSALQARVERTYANMQTHQTVAFVESMHENFGRLDKGLMTIWDAVAELDAVIDESDPDTELPQHVHAYQVAEAIRSEYVDTASGRLKPISVRGLFPEEEWLGLPSNIRSLYEGKNLAELFPHIEDWNWFPVLGFHDLGKVMALPRFSPKAGPLEQWAVVGDTFPVGCAFSDSNVFADRGFHAANPDHDDPVFSTKNGIYREGIGLENLKMSWGHDEYIHMVLTGNGSNIPKEGLYVLRFHSFYPWHTPKENAPRGYTHLASDYDWRMLPLVKAFQKADLYSKNPHLPPIEELGPRYRALVEKYISTEPLRW